MISPKWTSFFEILYISIVNQVCECKFDKILHSYLVDRCTKCPLLGEPFEAFLTLRSENPFQIPQCDIPIHRYKTHCSTLHQINCGTQAQWAKNGKAVQCDFTHTMSQPSNRFNSMNQHFRGKNLKNTSKCHFAN